MIYLPKWLCSHPFKYLHVEEHSTEKSYNNDSYPVKVTHHLYCMRCDKKLDLSYAKIVKGGCPI